MGENRNRERRGQGPASQGPKKVIFAEISQSLACSPGPGVRIWADHLQDFRSNLARPVTMGVLRGWRGLLISGRGPLEGTLNDSWAKLINSVCGWCLLSYATQIVRTLYRHRPAPELTKLKHLCLCFITARKCVLQIKKTFASKRVKMCSVLFSLLLWQL